MIINFTGRKTDVNDIIIIGNRGEANVTELKFVLPKLYEDIDLSLLNPSLEWNILNTYQDVVLLTIDDTNIDPNTIVINWLIPNTVLGHTGKGKLCLAFVSDDEVVQYRTNNVIIYVNDTIDVSGTIIPDLPESYTQLLEDMATLKSTTYTKAEIDTLLQYVMEFK